MDKLWTLRLGYNGGDTDENGNLIAAVQIRGGFPADAHWEDLVSLESLFISNVGLSGALPASLGRLPLLRELDISQNGAITDISAPMAGWAHAGACCRVG